MAPTIAELAKKTTRYLSPEKVALVTEAYRFAEEAHQGQRRMSGGPYIEHPLEVALLLADLQLDSSTITSALLHDVVEDCGVPGAELERRFGADVRKLVDGVTKLSKIETRTAEGDLELPGQGDQPFIHAESLRKMLVAMAEDLRVILIKLADRLHNMRTIEALPPEKRIRIARETLDIYAPLAHRLGIANIQSQLEDLAFQCLHPQEYAEITSRLAATRSERESFTELVVSALRTPLEKAELKAEVTGRAKHLYSIYQKMGRYAGQGRDFHQIYDLVAVRVLVEDISSCYAALGVVHSLWHPLSGEFDDYIAIPRENMYQSLHTAVLGPATVPFEVQIRTFRMHEVAEYGVAAHWRYKEGGATDDRFEERLAWLRQLLDWQKEEPGAEAFIESVQTDIFPDQVFAYTPKGRVIELPAGATTVDFAYRIHTDLGHGCAGAKVNGKMVSLDYQLQNGDTIEILPSRRPKGPSLDWLNPDLGYVKTANARNKIRHWFRRRARAENIQQGRSLLEKDLRRLHISISEEAVAALFNFDSVDDLLAALGSGAIHTHQLATKLLPPTEVPAPTTELPSQQETPPEVKVMGMGGLFIRLGRCCQPVAGDGIVGFITRSRGLTVHRRDCRNTRLLQGSERLVDVEWGTPSRYYSAKVAIEAWDRVGLLRDITTMVSTEKINIASNRSTHHKKGTVTEYLTLQTSGAAQLSRLLSRLESVKGVLRVQRTG